MPSFHPHFAPISWPWCSLKSTPVFCYDSLFSPLSLFSLRSMFHAPMSRWDCPRCLAIFQRRVTIFSRWNTTFVILALRLPSMVSANESIIKYFERQLSDLCRSSVVFNSSSSGVFCLVFIFHFPWSWNLPIFNQTHTKIYTKQTPTSNSH